MRTILIVWLILFFNENCVSISEKESFGQKEKIRLCFWNVKNLSPKGLQKETKGPFILKFIQECDAISLIEIRSNKKNFGTILETELKNRGKKYHCLDGFPKGAKNTKRREKYTTCFREHLSDIGLEEYADTEDHFARPPTLFSFFWKGKKWMMVPFHSRPKDKNELEKFQDVVDFIYKKHSDRRAFFGGDFNTGKNYQSPSFLKTLAYFSILRQLINGPTTPSGQEHDLIFTDPSTSNFCKGRIHNLDKLFSELDTKEKVLKVSDHYPVSAECEI